MPRIWLSHHKNSNFRFLYYHICIKTFFKHACHVSCQLVGQETFFAWTITYIHMLCVLAENISTATLANSEDPDERQHYAAFHLLKTTYKDSNKHKLENSTCDPLKYTIGSSILIISICMGKSTRIQRVKLRTLILPC